MSWFGYKKGIYMGLSLYSTGVVRRTFSHLAARLPSDSRSLQILFWSSAHYEKFWAFVVSAFISASIPNCHSSRSR